MHIYLDASPIIYLVENVSPFKESLVDQLSIPDTRLVTSELSRLECRIKPIRNSNQALLNDYDQFFSDSIRQLIPLSTEVIDLATEIRARFGFKTPDAIHLAAATLTGCDSFLTNDHYLQRFDGIRIHVITAAK